MRILLVVPWDLEIGGVVRAAGNLARYLQSRGHEVTFLHPGRAVFLKAKTTKWGFPGFELRMQLAFGERHPLVSVPVFSLLFPFTTYELVRLIRSQRIQVVNIHYLQDYFFYFALCRRVLPTVLVASIHGSDILSVGKPKVKYSRALRLLLGASDLVVTPSQQYQKVFLGLFPGFKDKTTFIHNGVDLAELQSCSPTTAEGTQERYILCIAGHNENKGVDVLLRAFKKLQELAPPVQLILAGDGPLRGQLEALAVALGISERTKFVGFQDRAQIAKLLHNCETFVLPSRAESFGIAVTEALACKKAVVATAVGGIPEIIEDGKTGILVEPDNPGRLAAGLAAVLTDTALRETVAANGYKTVVKRFRQEHTGAAYEAAFARLLARPGDGVYTHS